VTFNLTEGKVGAAINAVRENLYSLHVKKGLWSLKNQYDENNAKPKKDFVADLKELAFLGGTLWEALLADQPEQRAKLRDELLTNPSTIQVSRSHGTKFVFPWAAVYDIPLESDTSAHRTCRLLDEWEQAGKLLAGRSDCPYKDTHMKMNTICPFGFWGFKHIIEQPPSTQGRPLQTTIKVAKRPIGVNPKNETSS
jgi:hypothetical protein